MTFVPPAPQPVSLIERKYISQFGTDTQPLHIFIAGAPGDVDDGLTNVAMTTVSTTPVPVFQRAADHPSVGVYQVTLQSPETQTPGDYDLTWTYRINGTPQIYQTYITVGPPAPAYDNLLPEMKDVVEFVWVQFADAFDSVAGGPNLQDYYQTHFGRGRMAQLLQVAMGKVNGRMQPFQSWTLTPPGEFPVAQWPWVLEQGLYIECIRHLIRSYIEQPMADGVSVARLDRRDYSARWREILTEEEDDYKRSMEIFKFQFMGLGKPRVLVSGGVYGNYGPTRFSGSAAARPRYWARFYA